MSGKTFASRKIRRGAVLMALRSRQLRLALTLLVMPAGYSLAKTMPRGRSLTVVDITANEGDFA